MGIFTGSGGPITTIADTTGPFSNFGGSAINGSGTVAFLAFTGLVGGGIFTGSGGPITTLYDSSGPFNNFIGAVINDIGDGSLLCHPGHGEAERAFREAEAKQAAEEDRRRIELPEPVKVRNPFGLDDDVPGADDDVARAFAKTVNPPGGPDDANAAPWVPQATDGKPDSLDGEWFGRWNDNGGAPFNGPMAAIIKTVGDRVYILTGSYLIEARREKDRLIGKYISSASTSGSPWTGWVVDPERIDGQWTEGGGRWDFRRKLK